jgi:hypothetical protein
MSSCAEILKIPELIKKLADNGVKDTTGKNTRQLKDLCARHGIQTFKTATNSIERNRSELELDLRGGRGVGTKGKNKRELIELCRQHNISIIKTVDKSRKDGKENRKAYCRRFFGNEV